MLQFAGPAAAPREGIHLGCGMPVKATLVITAVLLLKAELQAVDQVTQHRLSSPRQNCIVTRQHYAALRQLSVIKVRKRYDCESAHKNVSLSVLFYLEHHLFRHFRTSIKDLTTN